MQHNKKESIFESLSLSLLFMLCSAAVMIFEGGGRIMTADEDEFVS